MNHIGSFIFHIYIYIHNIYYVYVHIIYIYTSKKGSNGNNIPTYHLWAILVKHDTGKRMYVHSDLTL